MIQPIMHDPLFLAQKSAPATPEDAPVARDLLDTPVSYTHLTLPTILRV